MRGAAAISIMICGMAALWTATPAVAQCTGLTSAGRISAGDVFALGDKPARLESDAMLSIRRQLRLAFVLAANTLKNGALIVKSQHADGTGTLVGSPDFVALKRDRHLAACTKQNRDPYSHAIPLARYVNYHFYYADDFTRNDDNLDSFHAEVGLRRQDGWLGSKEACLRTSDRLIRPQFMFDDRRRAPSVTERAFRVVSDTKRSLETPTLQAAPLMSPALSAQIVPFQRNTTDVSCVLATVDVPPRAQLTTISMVDVDDAAAGILNLQHSLTISWQATQISLHAARRH
jgi:hypothetical protein